MKDKIKKNLPFFQFGAVVITICLGVMTGIDKVISTRPIAEFVSDSFNVTQNGLVEGELMTTFTVKYKMKLDSKCEFTDANIYIEDSTKFTQKVNITMPMQEDKEQYSFIFSLSGYDIPFNKTNRLRGSLMYACENETHIVRIPREDGPMFVYLEPSPNAVRKKR